MAFYSADLMVARSLHINLYQYTDHLDENALLATFLVAETTRIQQSKP